MLDANALIMPFQFGLNLDAELARLLGEVKVVVPASVIDELSNLDTREARAALTLAAKYEVVETSLCGDRGVLDVAARKSAAVVTNDRELIALVNKMGLPVVRLRSGKYLVMSGD